MKHEPRNSNRQVVYQKASGKTISMTTRPIVSAILMGGLQLACGVSLYRLRIVLHAKLSDSVVFVVPVLASAIVELAIAQRDLGFARAAVLAAVTAAIGFCITMTINLSLFGA
jgi:hypothetical protein